MSADEEVLIGIVGRSEACELEPTAKTGDDSSTRASVFGAGCAPEYAGQGAWRVTMPRPDGLHGLVLMRNATGQAAGAIPLSDESCYVFILETTAERVRFPRVKTVYDASLQICRWEQQTSYDRSMMQRLMADTHQFLAGPF